MNSKKNYPKKNYSNEAEYGLVEDSLKMHRSGSNETALVSKISHTVLLRTLIEGC